jgi:PBP1b-binding outer membrane lipoprotein LpoB
MKKLTSVWMLASILALAAFAGCSSAPKAQDEVKSDSAPVASSAKSPDLGASSSGRSR